MTPEYLQEDAECADAYEKSVYTKMIRAGHRTYYIDVKQTRSSKYFMSLTELRRKITPSGIVSERSKVHIYEEDFDKLADGLREVLDFVKSVAKESTQE